MHIMLAIIAQWQTFAVSLGIFLGAVAVGLLANTVLFAFVRRGARRGMQLYASIEKHCYAPMRLLFPVVAADIVVPLFRLPSAEASALEHTLALALVGGTGWLLMRIIDVASDDILVRYHVGEKDDLTARKIFTQVNMFRRAINIVVGVLTFSVMIMTFSWAREFGTSLLASAGIAGLVVGMAARPTLANLIAGIQIALTEPIRIEDVVIVQGEWGWIEEINTTYVVVRIWDLRRLVMPISYLIEQPFQNWTRTTADLLGYVYIYVDYTAPLDAIRDELERVLKASPNWDGKVWNMMVTDSTERALQIRALMSASNSGLRWNLMCEVREKLIDFVQKNYPSSLPKTRGELDHLRAEVTTSGARPDGPPIGPGDGA